MSLPSITATAIACWLLAGAAAPGFPAVTAKSHMTAKPWTARTFATARHEQLAARPVLGRNVRGFDPPAKPWLAGHRGVDLETDVGQTVVAARAGVVVFAGAVAGTPVVSIDHGEGLHSTYEPVAASVSAGAHVLAGDVIGTIAPGAHCPRSCLHFGARRGQMYVEPFSALGLLPVLLPLHTSQPTDAAPR